MPFVSKRRRAAKIRWLGRKQSNPTTAAFPMMIVPDNNPTEPSQYEDLVPSPEPTIKQEPLEIEDDDGNETIIQQEEMKVELDLLDPVDSTSELREEQDPIAYDVVQEEQGDRCLFCLKLICDINARGAITRSRIEFVLGLCEWSPPGAEIFCCDGCRRMFDLFYDFKRSCLVALARPAELLVWAGASKQKNKKEKNVVQHVDLQPKRMPQKVIQRREEYKPVEVQAVVPKPKPEPKEVPKQVELEIQEPRSVCEIPEPEPERAPEQVQEPRFECEICLEKFIDRLVLEKHWMEHFLQEPNKSETIEIETPGSATTEELNRPTTEADIPAVEPSPSTTAANLLDDKHVKSYCSRCRKWFSTKTIFEHHKPFCIKFIPRRHPEKQFACTQCPEKFRKEQDLQHHINKHNGIRSLNCRREGCTKTFFSPKVRMSHEKQCGQDLRVICSVCGAIFKTNSALRVHMLKHEEPKYACKICNKRFFNNSNLKKHASAHSDARNFPCSVCGKRFKSYEANRVHQRIHTQEKPYVCHICGQRFTYNCLLKTHLEKGHEPEDLPAPN